MNIFARIRSSREQRKRRMRDQYLDSLITVEERAGQMWLTCDGHAVRSLPPDTSSRDILAAADSARHAARTFDRNLPAAELPRTHPAIVLHINPSIF